jgi:hypothetical protein
MMKSRPLLALPVLLQLSFRAVSCFVSVTRVITATPATARTSKHDDERFRSPPHGPPPATARTTKINNSSAMDVAGDEGLPAGGGREVRPTSSSDSPVAATIALEPTAEILAAVLASPISVEEGSDLPSLWKRRLITREDPYGIHKLSSVLYSISAIIILGTAAYRYFESPESFAVIPPSLEVPTQIFAMSNVVMCAVSTRMAFLHRRYDLTARNAFLGTGASSMFSGFFFLWTSPFGPDAFDIQVVSRLCFAILVFLNVAFIGDTMIKVPSVVESRRDRKAEDYRGRFWVDAVGYVLPVAWGLPPLLITFFVAAIVHDRAWFFEQLEYIDRMRGVPGMNADVNYLQVMTSVAASYGSLFVTLRDKKLITKKQELGWITVFSVPTMIWTVFTSMDFFKYGLH